MDKTRKQKSINKLITLMLAFVMVFTGMGIGSWGVDEAWADTTIGPKVVDNVYQISTAAELTWFASAINDGTAETQDAVLTQDIDLNNAEWTPIGTTTKKYTGTFDGRNKRISGLKITTPDLMAGLFGFADSGSKIENISVAGTIEISNFNQSTKSCMVGGIVAVSRGDIINCHNEVNITLTDFVCKTINAGGICGSIGLKDTVNNIVGCTNHGNISCSANPGAVNNFVYAGGIVGRLNYNPKVDSCRNDGSVTVHLTGFGTGCAGGITNLSYVNEVDINNCYSIGVVSVSKIDSIAGVPLCAGGIVGYSAINQNTSTIKYPTNCAYLTGTATVGMNNASGQAIADATSDISAKTGDELKSADFLASLNAAAPITEYAVTWITGADGYPTIKHGENEEPQNPEPEIVNGVYQIRTAQHLTWFASAINDGTAETQDAVLTNDIDLNNAEWTPIGTTQKKYTGIFDGQNKRISGLKITKPDLMAGIFGFTDSGSQIKNLSVAGTIEISDFNQSNKSCMIGGIVAVSRGDIINCHNEVNITLTDFVCKTINVGGICGSIGLKGTVNNIVGCSNHGNISCSANPGAVNNFVYAGGIVGRLNFNPKVDSCRNDGSIAVHLKGFGTGCAGGITNQSYVDEVDLNNCYSIGSVNVSKADSVGGVTLCTGGIVGYSVIDQNTSTIKYPTNCTYLIGTAEAGMSNTSGQAIADATSGISAKTEDELKSADFLASLNAAPPITKYLATWTSGTDGYPTISRIQEAVGIQSFTVAGVAATIDQTARTITAELPAGTDLTNLAPTIVCFADATSTPASGVAQDFTNPVKYTVGDIEYTVTITVAKGAFAGTGTQADPYLISSAELLQKLSTEYNQEPENWSGKYWKQTAEIDMSGVKFTPIGAAKAFSGTYDGGSFAIKNLSISSAAANVGLFGIVGNGATIKNVVLDSACSINASAQGGNVGGIVGQMNDIGTNTIENCVNHASVSSSAPNGFGSSPSKAGGIVGEILSNKNNLVLNCRNYGKVAQKTTADYYAGGIVGWQRANSVVAGCENHGEVTALSAETWTGLGNGSTAGGIAAYSVGYVSGCYNDGTVSGGMYVGGIAGKNQSGAVVESSYNAGTVTGNAAEAKCTLGGIVGDGSNAFINKCYNVGTCTPEASSKETKLGLIAGTCKNPKELKGNYFLGTEPAQGCGAFTNNETPTETMLKPVTETWLKSEEAVSALNDYAEPYSLYKATWSKNENGYPTFTKVEKILSHYAEIKSFAVTIDEASYTGTINGTDISIVLPAGTTSITPVITVSDKAAVSPASGTEVSLTDGSATFTVTAENGKQVTYNLHATISASEDGFAALQIYLPGHVLLAAKDFDDTKETYEISISDKEIVKEIYASADLYFKAIPAKSGTPMTASLNDGEEVTLQAVANMDVNGNSGSIRLWDVKNETKRPVKAGENNIKVKVGTGETAKTYTLKLTVVPTLSELSVTAGEEPLSFDKEFDGDTYAYTLDIPDTLKSLKLSAAARMIGKTAVTMPEGTAEDGTLAITNLDSFTVKVGDETTVKDYVITLNRQNTYKAEFTTTPANATVVVTDAKGKTVTPNADGTYALVPTASYTVTAGKPGYCTYEKTITASDFTSGKMTITLTKGGDSLKELTGDWTSFRGSDANMGIVDRTTPKTVNGTKELWAVKLGTGNYAGSPSQPLLLDGYLYTQCGRKLLKINTENGEIVKSADVSGTSSFTTNPITYGGGMLFLPIDDGEDSYIQAFNAETLESLWISEGVKGQLISPITYHNGYLYTGTWNSETANGTYYMLSATDEDTSKTDETKKLLWKMEHKGGFYWAGAYATDKYVVFGSDDGSNEGSSASSAVLYSVNPTTGAVISKITGLKGDIRSSIAYADGHVYFTTKGGMLYRVAIDANGTLGEVKSFAMGYMSTGTPVVQDGIVFASNSGADQFKSEGTIYAIDAQTMEKIAEVKTPGYIQSSMLLTTAYKDSDNALYLYATCNKEPGGILAVKYDLTAKTLEAEEIYTPDGDKAEYNICSLICDAEGTIYFKNDSTYLFAIGTRPADETKIAEVEFELNGGTAYGITEGTAKTYFASDAGKTLPIPSKSGYTFKGWFSENKADSKQYTQVSDELPQKLYAIWEKTASSTPSEDGKIRVTFRLIGAEQAKQMVDLSKNSYLPNYVTWISTKTYTVAEGTTVGEVFKKALGEAGISYTGYENNYIDKIKAPTSLGGYWLGEFDNGRKSGWMYTVNGSHPNKGLVEWTLNNNDNIVWHYVNDYSFEVEDWFNDPGYPSLATDAKYYNGWLKAADRVGSSGGGVAAGEVEETKDVTTDTKTGTTTAPTEVKITEKTNADGTKIKVAEVKVTADNQKEILKQAKANKSKEIILNVSKTAVGEATKAEVTLDKSFIDSIVKDTDSKLTVKTPFGDKTYTRDELKALSAAATGSIVTITVEKAAEEPADDAAKAEKIAKAKAIAGDMKLVARSSKTAKKNVKVTLKADKATSAAIKELKDLGFTVKYRFYRSTKKSAGYKQAVTKKTATYTNTSGKKGTKYFYKVQVRVYDEKGKLVAKTALKQCKYASRTWSR